MVVLVAAVNTPQALVVRKSVVVLGVHAPDL
jgi:hypothetical protein